MEFGSIGIWIESRAFQNHRRKKYPLETKSEKWIVENEIGFEQETLDLSQMSKFSFGFSDKTHAVVQ